MYSFFPSTTKPYPSPLSVFFFLSLALLAAAAGSSLHAEDAHATIEIGVAEVDITPEYPIRLSGYGGRRTESEGIDQRLKAKALAIGSDGAGASLLLTVDNTGVPAQVTEAVYAGLAQQSFLLRENFAVASSHTHTGPMLQGVLPFLFAEDIPEAHQDRIDRYTGELIEKLQEVALAALADRRPAFLSWGEGGVGFALNRRTPGGPVDHALPLLAVHSPEGELRAVLANYACHCTTLTHNKHHGDWAGYAQQYIEEDHPGSVAMIAIGAGADSDPSPRGELAHASQHGREIANEVSRLLNGALTPITEAPAGRIAAIELPFDTPPTREEFLARSGEGGIVGYHAQKSLERLDRGEVLPTTLSYEVQAWQFGKELAMVFLPGEVVVDYVLRLKEEFDNIWVTAYANDVPCYIPSERILNEGGYEGGFAMHYYDRPTRFASGVEALVIDAVYDTVPEIFLAEPEEDNTPPEIISTGSLDGRRVGVLFNEPVDSSSAEDSSNYIISAASVSAAEWQPDGQTVVLTLTDDGLAGEAYTLSVSGVKDLAGNEADTSVSGVVLGLTSEYIGISNTDDAGLAVAHDSIRVAGGGNDIWGARDEFHFIHEERSGDFDVKVRVAAFGPPDADDHAKAALMVREDLTPGSRHATLAVYPHARNWTAFHRLETGGESSVASGDWRIAWPEGINFPDVWMRVRRTGNTFVFYGGSNGMEWEQVGAAFTTDYPETVQVGLATAALADRAWEP